MQKEWLKVIISALLEIVWVIGFKYASTPLEWIGTITALGISFYVLIKASEKIPVGTVYAVFVGLGTFGTTIGSVFLFHEPFSLMKGILMVFLLIGIVGLKIATPEESEGH